MRSRVRNCTSPAPAFGGKDCSSLGDPQESEPCEVQRVCPGQFNTMYAQIYMHLKKNAN